MKRLIYSAIFSVAVIAMNSCNSAQPKQDAGDLLAAAIELDSLFLDAYNKGDAEALMQLYWNSSDLRVYTPGEMVLKGYDETKATYIRDLASNKGARLDLSDPQNDVYGDVVIGQGTFTWTLPVEGGSPMIGHGRYTEVKAMKDGKMVILLDHASVPMAPPPPEEMPSDSARAK